MPFRSVRPWRRRRAVAGWARKNSTTAGASRGRPTSGASASIETSIILPLRTNALYPVGREQIHRRQIATLEVRVEDPPQGGPFQQGVGPLQQVGGHAGIVRR